MRAIGAMAVGAGGLVAIVVVDHVLLGDQALLQHGFYDEVAHLITGAIVAVALWALRVPVRGLAVLAGTVAIDLDHVPLILGIIHAPVGTSRPESHSLAPVALLLVVALLHRRRRALWLSFALGIGSHLLRDLGTGTVLLAWPLSVRPISVPYHSYITIMVALVTAAAVRAVAARPSTVPGRRAPVVTARPTAARVVNRTPRPLPPRQGSRAGRR